MSDTVPGTLVEMRVARRFAHYNAGERIAVTMDQAQDLHARRLAQPLQLLVPASVESKPDATRQPAQVVRK
jgi:hypothetical protein